MPPLIPLVCTWLVGAYAGLATSLAPISTPLLALYGAIAAGVAGVWYDRQHVVPRSLAPRHNTPWRRRYTVGLTAACVAVAAILLARTSGRSQLLCREALASVLSRGDSVRVVFDDRVAPRASSRGLAAGFGTLSQCRVPLVGRVSEGSASPGRWVTMRGRPLVTARALRIDGPIVVPARFERDWRRAARGRTGEIIDRDFGANAPLVRALLIADQDGIPPSVRETFADAGLVHMLSISGLHVAIIAGALLTVASALRLSRTAAFLSALVVIVLYVAMLGAPPPAVRSAVMLAVVGLSERLQRPTHPWTALALGAVIPALQPAVVMDLGWQLSVGGMAALVAARALLRRLRQAERVGHSRRVQRWLQRIQRLDGWRYGLMREMVTGTVATVVTAPLIAWTLGRVSIIAPLSNLAAGPFVAFVQPALFLALLAAPLPALSRLVADATGPPLALLNVLANGAASIPHATLHFAPTAIGALLAGVASAAFVRATASRHWLPGLTLAAAALTLAIWAPLATRGRGTLEMHVLDVGQGDAVAIRTPRGRWVLVDAGRRWDGGDAGRRTVVPYVRRLGGPVAAFVLSHAHDDHVGGAASIVAALSPARWWEPAFVTTSAAYRQALVEVQQRQVTWRRARPGDRWQLDNVEFSVLAPDSAWTASQTDANETSVVLRVAYGRVVFLLTGDAEREEEHWMLQHTSPEMLRADVLKLGHHGSKTSSTPEFVEAVQPRVGVASVGTANRYGHPSPETLETFANRGIPIIRTDLEGTVVFFTDGARLGVRAAGDVWTVPDRTGSQSWRD